MKKKQTKATRRPPQRETDAPPAKSQRYVLVGTYKGDQLTKWRGWYNYPISEGDKIGAEDAAMITELWLFNGKKDQRTYKAQFVGIKTRAELIRDYGYPAKGRAHGEKYLLFKTDLKYIHKLDVPEDAERVIIRTADFATAPKVRKQLKAYLESPDRRDPGLAKRLPEIITRLRPEQLRVCEAAVQLDFFDEIVPQVIKRVKRNSTEGCKFALATVFSGIGAIEQALLRKHIDHEIVFACDNGDQTPFQCKAVEWKECEDEFNRLSKFVDAMHPTTESQQSAAEIVRAQRDSIKMLLDGAPATSKRPERELKDRVHMLYEAVGFYKFRVTWENEPDWKARKHLVDMLYRPLLNRNNVRKSYVANYDVDDERFHWNVSFLEGRPYRNKVDLFVGGSPCQSFSLVGKQMGLSDTRGTLFYEYARLVSEIRPKCFIYENVRALLSNDNGRTWATVSRVFTDLGYDWKYAVLNAKDYGMPQNRERVFVVGFRKDLKVGDSFQFPKPVELTLTMQDFLLDVVPGKYYLPEKGVEFVLDEGNLTKRYTQIDGAVQLCQKKNQQFNWHGDFVFVDEETASRLGMPEMEKYYLAYNLISCCENSEFLGTYA
ncbi:MAG: DNA (cytosine-5-)-methyltransferase [Fibrobacter sp.]|nr:DNA (cytosine-5-)-methyltransferase [Fibrobacter sp.]